MTPPSRRNTLPEFAQFRFAHLGFAQASSVQVGSTGRSKPEELASDAGAPTSSDAGAVTRVSAPASSPVLKYTEEDLQKIEKYYMDLFIQAKVQEQAPQEQAIEVRFPELYFGKSHMECFEFCLQCEDHFDLAGVTGFNRTTLAASFLRGRINFRWQQHKRRHLVDRPLSWDDFKAFLHKNLGNTKAFVDSVWRRFNRDSQYQKEEVMDWAFHLEYLQAILIEFDAKRAPKESNLMLSFEHGLKPSIELYIEDLGLGTQSWEKLVEMAKRAEAKAALQSPSYLRDMDHDCPQGNRPDNNSVEKTRASLSWDPRDESSKGQATSTRDPREMTQPQDKSADFLRPENANNKHRKAKKKQPCFDQGRARKDSTQAPTNISSGADNGGVCNKEVRKYLCHITCFNCNKTGHYANNCPEPRKNCDA